MAKQIEVQLQPYEEGTLRPPSIFRTAAEVAEADRLHSQAQKEADEEGWEEDVGDNADIGKWEVLRTVKNDSDNNTEIEVRFGFDFLWHVHLLKLQLK
jgi:hypothetical protein